MPETAATLPGLDAHPHARAVLGAALREGGAPSHAYLFQGPAGVGKRAVARAFAAELLAEGAADPDGARRRVQRGVHPDLTWVVPSGAHELLRQDVDEPVVAAAARTPFESLRRVFVLERVDTMNDEAASRMLKTLEEPAPHVHLVLLTERPTEVLPTIVSRCQRVRFDPLPPEQVAERLIAAGGEATTAQACARLALGDAGVAERLIAPDGQDLRAAVEGFAAAVLAGEVDGRPWKALLDLARRDGEQAGAEVVARLEAELELVPARDQRRLKTEFAERERRAKRRAQTQLLELGLQLTGLWLRDLACLALDAPDLVLNVDRRDELARAVDGRSLHALRTAVELVEDTRQRLVLNVTEELALEALAYRLARVLAA